MNNNENSIHRPYEIIETEETITRYFNLYGAKEPTFCTRNHGKTSDNNQQECPERNIYDRDDLKIVRNCQFEALHEKFNKLRAVMSELTEKFKEINLMKAQAKRSGCDGVDILFDDDFHLVSGGRKTKLPENSQQCTSRVSVESQTDHFVVESPTNAESDEKDSFPKTTEAALLRKSKEILVSLIDNELQKVEASQKALLVEKLVNVSASHSNAKQLKMECMDKIAEELSVLKDLEGICG